MHHLKKLMRTLKVHLVKEGSSYLCLNKLKSIGTVEFERVVGFLKHFKIFLYAPERIEKLLRILLIFVVFLKKNYAML